MPVPLATPPHPLAVCLAAVALLVAAACGGGQASTAPTETAAAVDSGLETFEAIDINGDTFDLAEALGKQVVVLSFWTTFCEPCKAEMPHLQRFHDTYGPQGLKILSISMDGPDTMAGVAPYIRTNGYTFQCVIDEDTSITNAYNPRPVMPFMVIIDRSGQIVKTIEGFRPSEVEALETELKALVAGGH